MRNESRHFIMKNRLLRLFLLTVVIFLMSSCSLLNEERTDVNESVTLIDELVEVDYFRDGALEHILEGELNRRDQAVGYHYDKLPTKKGEIISDTETEPNEFGVYEAKVTVNDVEKQGNNGISSFFPDEWDTQDVIDRINEAYEEKVYITGNTYEGLTDEGIVIRMYLDDEEKIISAFPVY